jgi:hypothetical protein
VRQLQGLLCMRGVQLYLLMHQAAQQSVGAHSAGWPALLRRPGSDVFSSSGWQ